MLCFFLKRYLLLTPLRNSNKDPIYRLIKYSFDIIVLFWLCFQKTRHAKNKNEKNKRENLTSHENSLMNIIRLTTIK